MEMRSEFRGAQQARRDKLRALDSGDSNDNPYAIYADCVGNNEMGYELCPCPEMLNVPANTRSLPGPQWKSIGSEFVANHNPAAAPAPMFVGESVSSSSVKLANTTTAPPQFIQQDQGEFFGPVHEPVSFPEKPMDPDLYTQGALSLSLSSVPPPTLAVGDVANLARMRKDVVVGHRNPGPLGPFTGYAIILRNSKFLRPAHQLLEELCFAARPKILVDEIRVSGEDSGGSSQVFDEQGRDPIGTNYSAENLQTRARLLFLQEEVSKRYTQYHQQIQLVVSSFETVAGLSSATPYVSLAVKSVSKHFRFLKNAISDHLKNLRTALGHDSCPPSNVEAGPTFAFSDRGFLMSSKGPNDGAARHSWRPQRGLPERAVAILRAWLFDHFLHPYPTDTDKHMLASQTGLTRSQVSNWFINARVRIWKPMVEEIHMLETKALAVEEGPSPSAAAAASGGSQSLVQGHHQHEMNESDGWNQDKRSRVEYHPQPAPGIRGSIVGFGGGSVSLTLGLRQSAENAQPGLPESHHLRQQFGSQFIRDFVG